MCMFIVAIDARGRTNTSNKYTNTTNNNNKQYHQRTKINSLANERAN